MYSDKLIALSPLATDLAGAKLQTVTCEYACALYPSLRDQCDNDRPCRVSVPRQSNTRCCN